MTRRWVARRLRSTISSRYSELPEGSDERAELEGLAGKLASARHAFLKNARRGLRVFVETTADAILQEKAGHDRKSQACVQRLVDLAVETANKVEAEP